MILSREEAATVQAISMVDIFKSKEDKAYYLKYLARLFGHPIPPGQVDSLAFRVEASKKAQMEVMRRNKG